MIPGKKIYFASDFHLGIPSFDKSLEREKLICNWLDSIKQDAEEIYLVGDIFDFWYEYRYTVPKGFTRFLGKIAELCDAGVKIHFFSGNHDMWMKDYFEKELGVKVYHQPITITCNQKIFFIGHGDGLGPGDTKYKFLKFFFRSNICQWLFSRLHPNFSFAIANAASRKSRLSGGYSDEVFLGENKEWLIQFCKEYLKTHPVDYFIFGHRHLALDIQVANNSRYINLGQWINGAQYAVFDGNSLILNKLI
jgi:UDP-2,3-diacylglucosamine hydrolase